MDNDPKRRAASCLANMRMMISASEFGFKVQALAAHVLLRLGWSIDELNQFGHPDIVARQGSLVYHIEIEAEVKGTRPRQLTKADFASLIDIPDTEGWYGLAIAYPTPRWILVPAKSMVDRRPSYTVLLEALSDKQLSSTWSNEYIKLLDAECDRITRYSFNALRDRALAGRGL